MTFVSFTKACVFPKPFQGIPLKHAIRILTKRFVLPVSLLLAIAYGTAAQSICFDRAEFESDMAFTVYDSVHVMMVPAKERDIPLPGEAEEETRNDVAVWHETWPRVDSEMVWLFEITFQRWDRQPRTYNAAGEGARPTLNRCYQFQRTKPHDIAWISYCDLDAELLDHELLMLGEVSDSRWPEILLRVLRQRCLTVEQKPAILHALASDIELMNRCTVSGMTINWGSSDMPGMVDLTFSWVEKADHRGYSGVIRIDRSVILDCTVERGTARLLRMTKHTEQKRESGASPNDESLRLAYSTETMRISWE